MTQSKSVERPQPEPEPAPPPFPEDRRYPGTLRLQVDATDVARAIFRIRLTLPIAAPGPLTLLYPKWIPGFHSPASAIELLAGLQIEAAGRPAPWRRHPVEVHAFEVDAPDAESLELNYQFLSPTASSQGAIAVTPEMLLVQWAAMILYPAGYFSRGIEVEATLILPEGWSSATALEPSHRDGATTTYRAKPLDELVDSPVLAGRWFRALDLDEERRVRLNLFADRLDLLDHADEHAAPHRKVVAEADALFGSRHFDRYDFLAAVSDELGGGGVEHQRSSEIVAPAGYFTSWDANAPNRDVFAHEYVHSWNGKFRRGADSWTLSFERPIRNSLMWVYEGQTQYWGQVLTARSGLWSTAQALDALARTAAIYQNRPGGRWRPMSDTTRDPIIASRQPLPWPSWQRSEDYYSEGQLLWLDVDTLIRELTGDARSLDDFARWFFGVEDGRTTTLTYAFEDIVAALREVAPHDWSGFLTARLESREVGAPIDGLARGGYQLVYRKHPSDFYATMDAANGVLSLNFSLGLVVGLDGVLQEVIWEGPAYHAGLVAGSKIVAVNGETFSAEILTQAVEDAEAARGIEFTVQRGKRLSAATVSYSAGHRFPHLERIEGQRPRLEEILAPRT